MTAPHQLLDVHGGAIQQDRCPPGCDTRVRGDFRIRREQRDEMGAGGMTHDDDARGIPTPGFEAPLHEGDRLRDIVDLCERIRGWHHAIVRRHQEVTLGNPMAHLVPHDPPKSLVAASPAASMNHENHGGIDGCGRVINIQAL